MHCLSEFKIYNLPLKSFKFCRRIVSKIKVIHGSIYNKFTISEKTPESIYTINIADKRQDDKLSPYKRTLFHT